MNWTRIFAATALTAWALGVGGVIWLSDPGSSHRPRLLRGNAVATITIGIEDREPEKNEGALIDGFDANTFAWMLRSQKLTQRAIASFAPDELARVLGNGFLETGETPFRGVTVEAIRSDHIRIVSGHRDVAAARLVAERLIVEFVKLNRELTQTEAAKAVAELEERKTKLSDEAKLADTALAAMSKSANPSAYENAERDAKIRHALLRNLDGRIAETATWRKQPPRLFFQISSAHVASGPFWNRVTTDFTAEAQRLVER